MYITCIILYLTNIVLPFHYSFSQRTVDSDDGLLSRQYQCCRQQCVEHGRTLVEYNKIPGDGNCLFHCFIKYFDMSVPTKSVRDMCLLFIYWKMK